MPEVAMLTPTSTVVRQAMPVSGCSIADWMPSLNEPPKMRNSPTKPLVRGSAMLDMVTNTKNVAYTGMRLAMPPKSAISRV
jgi:hypothetical protein